MCKSWTSDGQVMKKSKSSDELVTKLWTSHQKVVNKPILLGQEQALCKSWKSNEQLINKSCTSQDYWVMNSHKQAIAINKSSMNKLGSSKEYQSINKSWLVINKTWIIHKQVMKKSWARHEQFVNKSWMSLLSCEKVMIK